MLCTQVVRRLLNIGVVIGCTAMISNAAPALGGASTMLDQSRSPPLPTARPAIDGIFDTFKNYPLVGLSDVHGMAQEEDFYIALLSDPRFATEVGNVVVEFGDSTHQAVLDRWMSGETVPYTELRKIWTDAVGWVPTVTSMGYINFLAQVRSVNLAAPPERRIRVWLGEPEIDWPAVKTFQDLAPVLARRDSYPAELIVKEILEKGKHALVIYGGAHLSDAPFLPSGDAAAAASYPSNLRAIVEKDHPRAFSIVSPYIGFVDPCTNGFEKIALSWPVPALVSAFQAEILADKLAYSGCAAAMRKRIMGESILYLGPVATLTYAADVQDINLDADYRQEVERRYKIRTGRPLSPQIRTLSPRRLRP